MTPPPELTERLAGLQRPLGDGSYLAASWDSYYTRRFRDVCAIVRGLVDPLGGAGPGETLVTVLEYGCSSGPLFRALEHYLGSLVRFRFIGVESDWRASGYLRAKMPAAEVHEADLARLEELAAEGLTADVCVGMSQFYSAHEDTARRLIAAFAAIAPHVILADQIDNVEGESAEVLALTDQLGRPYEALCHPFRRALSDAGYSAVAAFPAREPCKSLTGYIVAVKTDDLPSEAITRNLAGSESMGDEPIARPVTFGPVLGSFLRTNKLACMDVGAAGGVHDLWRPYGEFIEVDAFEPNEESCRRAAVASPPFVNWHPVALGAVTGSQPFYVLNASTGSSFYPPNDEVQQFFNGSSYRRVNRVVDVETITIPDFMRRFNRPVPSLIKLDTQGSELDILRAIDDSQWPDVLAIETEVEFVELYRQQPLFCDVDRFLRSKGMLLFDLRTAREYCCAQDEVAYYLNRHFHVTTGRNDMSARLYAGDALYIRDRFTEPPQSRDHLLRLIAALLIYLYFDYAIHFCEVGLQRGLLDASERDALIAEIVAGAPPRRPVDHVYQAFWQVRNWPNQ